MSNYETNIMLYTQGDSSVGMSGQTLTVSYDSKLDTEDRQALIEALSEAFENFTGEKVRVIEEQDVTCRHCRNVFQVMDEFPSDVCNNQLCIDAEVEADEEARRLEAESQAANYEAMSEKEKDNFLFGADQYEDFRERNARVIAQYNGAGVRS